MSEQIEARLSSLGLSLPEAAVPVANYVTTQTSGNQLYLSGQLPIADGKLIAAGKVGKDVTLEAAQNAAQACALNLLAQAKKTIGSLDKIKKVVKITAFVAADPAFTDVPKVANGASDLLVNVLGEKGKHARSAVGVAVLPINAPVEVEAIFEVE